MYEFKRIKSIFADKGNNGTRFGAPLCYLKQLHFFNKTDLEQYLFKKVMKYCLQTALKLRQIKSTRWILLQW